MGNEKQELTRMEDLSLWEKLFIRHGYKKLLKLIEEKYGDRKDLMILDAGCGPGVFADELKKKGILYGLDNDICSLISKKRFNKACGDIAFSPFKENSFDVVISRSSFGYWRDKKMSVDEILRVLKPESYFFIYDLRNIENGFLKRLLILADILMVGSLRKVKDTRHYIETRYDADRFKDLIRGRGMELKIMSYDIFYGVLAGKNTKNMR